jgi:hypothetical protein
MRGNDENKLLVTNHKGHEDTNIANTDLIETVVYIIKNALTSILKAVIARQGCRGNLHICC